MSSFRYSTLQFVNKILNGLDLDPVSTIGETEDSEQVLDIVDRTYAELDLDLNWFPRKTVVTLSTASGTDTDDYYGDYPDVPWAMAIPTGVEAVYKVYYNNKRLEYISPEEMLYRIEKSTANLTDKYPSRWTIGLFDEDYIYFDSFSQDDEAQLTQSNSKAFVTKYSQELVDQDSEVLNMPEKYYAALLLRCLMYGFYELNKDVATGDRYRALADIAKAKLTPGSRRGKIKNIHPGGVFFPRKTRSGIYITNDSYVDVS